MNSIQKVVKVACTVLFEDLKKKKRFRCVQYGKNIRCDFGHFKLKYFVCVRARIYLYA